MGRILAAADIGSNTAHLLVAEVEPDGLRRIVNDSDWLSLGEVVKKEGVLPDKLSDRLIDTLKVFRQKATACRAEEFYVFATEAMRRAENHDELLRRIADVAGLYVEIITPRREAELSLKAVQKALGLSGPFTLVEAGGGSVQVAACGGAQIGLELSLPLGTGTLIAESLLFQPAAESSVSRLAAIVDQSLSSLGNFPKGNPVVACGGVARGIWRSLHPDGEPMIFRRECEHLAWDVARLSLGQITARYSVKPKRAATLLPGATLYSKLMSALNVESMLVTDVGVREGAVWEMAEKRRA